jgi:hypothetical protein
MNVDNLAAIDVHAPAEVSCRQPVDLWRPHEAAANKYSEACERPATSDTIAYYPRTQDRSHHVHCRQRVRDLIQAGVIEGFRFHPTPQGFSPATA